MTENLMHASEKRKQFYNIHDMKTKLTTWINEAKCVPLSRHALDLVASHPQDTLIPPVIFNELQTALNNKCYSLQQKLVSERHGGGYGGDSYNVTICRIEIDFLDDSLHNK
jgi:hypothetical protein